MPGLQFSQGNRVGKTLAWLTWHAPTSPKCPPKVCWVLWHSRRGGTESPPKRFFSIFRGRHAWWHWYRRRWSVACRQRWVQIIIVISPHRMRLRGSSISTPTVRSENKHACGCAGDTLNTSTFDVAILRCPAKVWSFVVIMTCSTT